MDACLLFDGIGPPPLPPLILHGAWRGALHIFTAGRHDAAEWKQTTGNTWRSMSPVTMHQAKIHAHTHDVIKAFAFAWAYDRGRGNNNKCKIDVHIHMHSCFFFQFIRRLPLLHRFFPPASLYICSAQIFYGFALFLWWISRNPIWNINICLDFI